MLNLRNARDKKGYTQAYVASIIGVSRTAYNKYENGVHNPDNNTLTKLAEIFECTVDYLLGVSSATPSNNQIYGELGDLGENLKQIRENLELTHKEVSKKTGISSKTLSQYENNVSYPDLDTFRILLLLYGASADMLLKISPYTFSDFKNCIDIVYSEEEKQIIELYRQLPDNMKIEIKGEMKGVLRATHEEQSASIENGKVNPNKKVV